MSENADKASRAYWALPAGGFGLLCNCGNLGEFDDNLAAYDAGWRTSGQTMICPACMAKRDRAWRRKAVAAYGEAAVARAEQIMREKHR